MHLKLIAIAAFAAVTFSNCATIVSKTSYPVGIDSDPVKAQVTITDRKGKEVFKGGTPATVHLKCGAGYFKRAIYTIVVEKEGFQKSTITLNANLNGWYFGNLLFGGFIGLLVVDPISGAMYRMKNKDVRTTLVPLNGTSMNEPQLKILDINKITPEMRASLVPLN